MLKTIWRTTFSHLLNMISIIHQGNVWSYSQNNFTEQSWSRSNINLGMWLVFTLYLVTINFSITWHNFNGRYWIAVSCVSQITVGWQVTQHNSGTNKNLIKLCSKQANSTSKFSNKYAVLVKIILDYIYKIIYSQFLMNINWLVCWIFRGFLVL